MSKSYEVNGGQVLRDGEPIANYDKNTGKLDFLPDKARFRAPVVEFLRSLDLPVEAPTGKTVKKSGVPADLAPKADSEAAEAPQGEDEATDEVVTISKAELEAMKAKLAAVATVEKQADALSTGISKKVVFCPPSEKIFDPEVGHIRG